MAEETPQPTVEAGEPAAEMELEPTAPEALTDGSGNGKREREGEEEEEEEENEEAKRRKAEEEKSVEEERLKSLEEEENEREEEKVEASLGPKKFGSAVEMFDYFYKFLHSWSPNLDVNKYEYMVLLDLLKKGHSEPDKKIGEGIEAFQVRYHPLWKSRCFFLVRVDGSSDDFSFRKCVDHILPLPENMKAPSTADGNKGGKKFGGHQKGGNQGGRRGYRGRGGGGGRGGRGHGKRGGK